MSQAVIQPPDDIQQRWKQTASKAFRSMPANVQMTSCIALERGALVFWSPDTARHRPGTRVQIVDVFSLQVATGYTRDPQGRLLLEAQPSLAAGRSWSLAKAAQLIRNDARPHRWVALQMDKRAWGLFWAGGGLQRCQEILADRVSDVESSTAVVPATPEALLRLMLDLGSQPEGIPTGAMRPKSAPAGIPLMDDAASSPWKLVAMTSLIWLVVLGITVAGFLSALGRQDRKLELLLERTAPPSQAP